MEREASCPRTSCGPWWRHGKSLRTSDCSKDTVVFNVGGRCFQVLRHVIASKPSTLLAQILDDISTPMDGQALYVDANPDRFAHVLDWYRYGEMFVDGDCNVRAVLRDARFFQLPDMVRINGEMQPICPRLTAAQEIAAAARQAVSDQWPTFDAYVQRQLDDLAKELDCFRRNVDHTFAPDDTYSAPSWPSYLYKDYCVARRGTHCWEWEDVADLNSDKRLSLLLFHLRRRGLDCSVFWDQEQELQLRIGVNLEMDNSLGPRSSTQPFRVVVDGLRSHDGRLCVVQHADC